MAYTMTTDERAMVKAAAYGRDGAAEAAFFTAVQALLDALQAAGIPPTTNHVRSCITTVVMKN
jgi:hypothetical protein